MPAPFRARAALARQTCFGVRTDRDLGRAIAKFAGEDQGNVATTSMLPMIASLKSARSSAGIQYSRCARPPAPQDDGFDIVHDVATVYFFARGS